jgi:hypothetical protein
LVRPSESIRPIAVFWPSGDNRIPRALPTSPTAPMRAPFVEPCERHRDVAAPSR